MVHNMYLKSDFMDGKYNEKSKTEYFRILIREADAKFFLVAVMPKIQVGLG